MNNVIKYPHFSFPYSLKKGAVLICAAFLFFYALPLTASAYHTPEHAAAILRGEIIKLQAQIESIQATCSEIVPESVSQALALDAPVMSATSLANTTQELIKKQREFKRTGNTNILLELRPLAKVRKTEFVRIMRENPDLALKSLLPGDIAGAVASRTSNCVEETSEVEGTLEIVHADYFDQGAAEEYYSLVLPTKERVVLHPAKGLLGFLESGTKVKIRGFQVDSDMVFNGTASLSAQDPAGGIEVVARLENPPVLGDQKVLLVLFAFADRGNGMDLNSARDAVFATNGYYKETSYNLASVSGDTKGIIKLPINHTCSTYTVQSEIIKVLDPTVDFTKYSHMIMIGPFNCGWSGIATIGKIQVSTADGAVQMSRIGQNTPSTFVTAHELGHGFGNHHASFYQCYDQAIKAFGCTKVEYGDRYDTLGSAMGHYNASHKEYTGWLTKGSNILEVLASGRFTLEPIETATGGLKALKIPRGPIDYLYIEYRQPIGFDSVIGGNSDVFQGGLVHTNLGIPTRTFLIDTSPPGDANTAALLPGKTIVDPASGNSVTTVSVSPTALVVDANIVRTDFIPPTTVITSPVQQSAVSGVVRFAADVNDPSGVGRVEFSYRTPSTDWTLIATDTTAPYETNWDSTVVEDGYTYLQVEAYDTLDNLAINAMSVTVRNGIDNTPPTVNITSPQPGATVSGTIDVSALASDNVGVLGVQFKLDGVNLGAEVTEGSPGSIGGGMTYSLSWDTSQTLNGAHTITAIARDAKNNKTTSASVTINVGNIDTPPPPPPPPPPVPQNAFLGQYYDNQDLTNLKVTRTDSVINFNWGSGSPDPLIGIDTFSVRWEGDWNFATVGTYRFTATTDDGFRMWIDGALVLDKWIDQPPTVHSIDKTLTQGTHRIKVEYYENGGGATSILKWLLVTPPPPVDNIPPSVPTGLNATAISSTQINLSWNPSTDNVGVAGYKVFRSTGLGGTFVQIATVTGTTYQNAGLSPNTTYSYTVSAFDAAGNVSGQSSPKSATTLPASDTTPPITSITSPLSGATVSGTINVSANASDNVGVVGVQFKLDGANLGTEDTAPPYSISWNTANAINGNHTLTAVARDVAGNFGTAPAVAVTVSNNVPPPPPPIPTNAFLGQYYDNKDLTNLKVTRTDQVINFSWGNGSPDPSIGIDTFSVRWEGDWNFATAGTYRFTAKSDDGFRMWIDGVSALDKWIDQPPTTYTIDRNLTQGTHRVRVEYYENGVGATAILGWLLVTPPPPPPADTTPPSVPTSLIATAISSTQINLSWTASTDNVGVVGYKVFRSSGVGGTPVQIATVTGTIYQNTGLSPNTTYNYTVSAYDAAGNNSAQSSVASATTPPGTSINPGSALIIDLTATGALNLKLKAIQTELNRIAEIVKNLKF